MQSSDSRSCINLTNDCVPLMVYQGKVLEPLGAITSGSQFLEPDGTYLEDSMLLKVKQYNSILILNLPSFAGYFPNHIPNPEDKDAMKAITKAVLDNKADLGIIFDTDVDR